MKPRTTVDFLEALKARYSLTSDYKLFKFLGISQSTVSNYRIGKQHFNDEIALKVAALLEMAPGYVLACIHEERTKSQPVKAAWNQVARALAPSLLVFLAGALGATPQSTQGSDLAQRISMYIMSSSRRAHPPARSSLLGLLRRFSPFQTSPGTVFALFPR